MQELEQGPCGSWSVECGCESYQTHTAHNMVTWVGIAYNKSSNNLAFKYQHNFSF